MDREYQSELSISAHIACKCASRFYSKVLLVGLSAMGIIFRLYMILLTSAIISDLNFLESKSFGTINCV